MSDKNFEVFDEMLKKLDSDEEQSIADFNKEMMEKLSKAKEYDDIYSYLKENIEALDYSKIVSNLYVEAHKEALNKYLNMVKEHKDIEEVIKECIEEEESIKIVIGSKSTGYKDGLYLFRLMALDILDELGEKDV